MLEYFVGAIALPPVIGVFYFTLGFARNHAALTSGACFVLGKLLELYSVVSLGVCWAAGGRGWGGGGTRPPGVA